MTGDVDPIVLEAERLAREAVIAAEVPIKGGVLSTDRGPIVLGPGTVTFVKPEES